MEEDRDDEGMDVDTPPLSAVSRPEQATIVCHDGLEQGHAGNLSNEAELLTGAEVGSGRTANDVRWVRGSGGQRHMVVLPAYAEVVAEGRSGHVSGVSEREQWELDVGHNLRGQAGLSPALSLGRRDSGERTTLRCSSFHLPPPLSSSPAPSSSHRSFDLAADRSDHGVCDPDQQDRSGEDEIDTGADLETLRLRQGTVTRPQLAYTASFTSTVRFTPGESLEPTRLPPQDAEAGATNFRIQSDPIVPADTYDTNVPGFPLSSRQADVEHRNANIPRTPTITPSLPISKSSSVSASAPDPSLQRSLSSIHARDPPAQLDARSRGSIRPRPIKFSSSSRYLPAPYPTSLPLGTAHHRIIPTLTFISRFDLHSRCGMVEVPTPTLDLLLAQLQPPLASDLGGSSAAGDSLPSASLPAAADVPLGVLPQPSGAMSMSGRRQAPPAWPSAPRREAAPTSHRQIIARSAGLAPPPGYTHVYPQTPASLRVPPSAQWSPAFHRSGHGRQHASPYAIPPSPTRGYVQPPHSANPVRRAFPSSAPMPSSPRVPEHLFPVVPSPSPVRVTRTPNGAYRYENVTVDWVSRELHLNAPRVWNDLHTTDCKIGEAAISDHPRLSQTSPG